MFGQSFTALCYIERIYVQCVQKNVLKLKFFFFCGGENVSLHHVALEGERPVYIPMK